jgi:hypothetical protein
MQEKERHFKEGMEKMAESIEVATTDLKGKLAVQAALANGWGNEVRELTHKLKALEEAHKLLLDTSTGLKEQKAFAEGKTLAIKAQHELAVSQLRAELKQQKQEAHALQDAKAVLNSQLHVRLCHQAYHVSVPTCSAHQHWCVAQALHGFKLQANCTLRHHYLGSVC